MTDRRTALHSVGMGWNNKYLMMTLLACAPACPLDSKSLGEDDSSSDSADDESDASVGESSATDTGGEPLPPAARLWSQSIDDVTPLGMSIAADGSIYVAGQSGYTYEGGDGGSYASAWVGKFDATGTLVWNAEPGPGIGYVAATSDGAVFTTTDVDGVGEVSRYDADGEVMWTVPREHRADAIAVGPDDRIVLGGYRTIEPVGIDVWAAGLDGDGTQAWEVFFGDVEEGNSAVQALTFTPDGDVVLAGRIGIAPASSQSKAWIAKLSGDGATRWDQTISAGEATDWITGVDAAADGTIHAVVWAGASRTVRAFDGAGVELWSFEAEPVGGITGVAVATDGSFVLTDGEQLPFEDPEACEAPWGPCPSGLRVARHDADRSVRWFDAREDCNLGVAADVLPDDRVIVVGACPPEIGLSEVSMGLFAYEP